MYIGHNTAIGGDSDNLRILGFWIEREVQNSLLFTWLNQELDKEQIESQVPEFSPENYPRSIKQELLSALTWILYWVTERLKVDRVISARINNERLVIGCNVKIHGLDGSSRKR